MNKRKSAIVYSLPNVLQNSAVKWNVKSKSAQQMMNPTMCEARVVKILIKQNRRMIDQIIWMCAM